MLVYRVRIDSPLPDGTRIIANAQIASQETPAFSLEPAALIVRAAPDFGDDRTTFSVEPAHASASGRARRADVRRVQRGHGRR